MTGPERGLFLYGVVRADERAAETVPDLTGLDDQRVRLLQHGSVAAVVSEIDLDRPPGRRAELVRYNDVLDGLASSGPVVPVRFGTVLPDDEAVVLSLLEPNGDHFRDLLDDLRGRRQFNLKATYVEDVVLAEIVRDDPEVRALRERTRDLPEEAAYGDRVRLGELVSQGWQARAERDSQSLLADVLPLVVADAPRSSGGSHSVVDVALLVDEQYVDDLLERLEGLAEAVHERIHLQLVGPVAPFDFVGDL